MPDVAVAVQPVVAGLSFGQHRTYCPVCRPTRSNKRDKSLSVRVDEHGGVFTCHHCGVEGSVSHTGGYKNTTMSTVPAYAPPPREERKVIDIGEKQRSDEANEYLLGRGLTQDVIDAHTICGHYTFQGQRLPAIGFPYRVNGDVTAVKWRSLGTKKFSQQGVCEDFFLIDTYKDGNDILICEGEMDALSWLSINGMPDNVTVLSIPNGAPSKVKEGRIDPTEDRKFRYLWHAERELYSARRIYINADADEPGRALYEELLRRLDRHKVWQIDLAGSKDASEALQEHGETFLLERFHRASPAPLVGLHTADEFADPFDRLYSDGLPRGVSTGIPSLDPFFTVNPGMVTIVTGIPSHGKSDLIDQICLNLAEGRGWRTVYCSFEKPVELHMVQLSEKVNGKQFFEPRTQLQKLYPRMTEEEKDYARSFINDHFTFMDHRRGGPMEINEILDHASAAILRHGCRNLVIDPFNWVDLDSIKGDGRATNAINNMLTALQQFAKEKDCHVFFVAHPRKFDSHVGTKKVVPRGNDIAESNAWEAKADFGLSVWRDKFNGGPSEVHIWKVKWSWLGREGFVPLNRAPDEQGARWSDHSLDDDYDWDW